jgi:predicted Zn-dependent peptidase
MTRDQMMAYFNRRYVGPNIHVVAAGKFDWSEFLRLIERHCGGWPNGVTNRTELRQPTGAGGRHVITRPSTAQEYVIISSSAPEAESPLRYAAAVLSVAVGDYTGSRLYWALVDPGRAESADMTFSEYQAAGVMLTTFSCDPDLTAANLATVQDILAKVRKEGITADELTQAKSKLASREVRAGERTMRRMLAVGRDWAYLNAYRSIDDELAAIDAVSLSMVRDVLDQYPPDRNTVVALGPVENLN